jgi:ABC-type Fe3+/spermidine/putrescine transport system ATPase subunit
MLELRNIRKEYEGQVLLGGISFTVGQRETVCILGPSGSGKSTLLRLIAGLEAPEAGQVLWDGQDLTSVPSYRRDFGLVFQDYALFPHLDVFDNVAFGLQMRNWSHSETAPRVAEALGLVDLAGFEHRGVTDLSGGEQQRVALARALAPHPRLLMFDEPLGALDRALREDLLTQVRAILHQTGSPAIYVTHDQEEAFTIADRVLLLHAGQIVRAGTPSDVWAHPGSVWAAGFLGLGNILPGLVLDGTPRVETQYGIFAVKCQHTHRVKDQIYLLVRPGAVGSGAAIKGVVRDVVFRQEQFRVVLQNGLYFDLPGRPRIGRSMTVKIRLECLGPHTEDRSPSQDSHFLNPV